MVDQFIKGRGKGKGELLGAVNRPIYDSDLCLAGRSLIKLIFGQLIGGNGTAHFQNGLLMFSLIASAVYSKMHDNRTVKMKYKYKLMKYNDNRCFLRKGMCMTIA